MQADILITKTETGNYAIQADFPAGCNVTMVTRALKEQIEMLQEDFAEVVNKDGMITARLQTAFEITPTPKPYQFTCIYCPRPVDVDNGQEICDTCLNEPAPIY